MSGAQVTASLGHRRPEGRLSALTQADWITPNMVIAAAATLALALRAYLLLRPGFLLGVTEYDDGSYFGSAIRLVHGQLPYRDFVFVQPPGITLLMMPAALAAKVTGTAWGLAIGRLLTVAASTAGVVLAGLLTRHRGRLAVLVAGGICAVHPDGIEAAHTVLVEPWLALLCLIGAVTVFQGDRLTAGRRLAWGGVAFGLAGVIEVWAVVPVLVLLVLLLVTDRGPRRAAVFGGAVAAGFAVPTLPFAALAPVSFYRSVVVAQVGHRAGAASVYFLYRIRLMAGLADVAHPSTVLVAVVAAGIAGFVLAGSTAAWALTRRGPAALDWFAAATGALIAAAFLWPPQFHYHFVGFLAPFLALSVALTAGRLTQAARMAAAGRASRAGLVHRAGPGRRFAAAVAVLAVAAAGAAQGRYEGTLRPSTSPAQIAAAARVIPPGACVLADQVSYLVAAGRLISKAPGCPMIDDGTGVNYALSHGLSAGTGAGRVPAVATVWRSAFARAQFVWLSYLAAKRIPWTPAIEGYFRSHFTRVPGLGPSTRLYRRDQRA